MNKITLNYEEWKPIMLSVCDCDRTGIFPEDVHIEDCRWLSFKRFYRLQKSELDLLK